MPLSNPSPKKSVISELKKLTVSSLSEELLSRHKEAYRFTFSFDSMLKLYLFIKIKGYKTYSKALKYLKDNEGEALDLGFFKDTNDKIVLPNYRTVSDYFNDKFDDKTKKILGNIAKKFYVAEIPQVSKAFNFKKEKRNKIKEVTRLVKNLVYPQIKIKQHHNTEFTTKDLLDVLVHVAYTHDFAHNGAETFLINSNLENAPSSHIMLYHFKKFRKIEDLKEMFKIIFDIIFDFGKKNYNLLKRRQLDIAIDIHDVPYYGEENCEGYVLSKKPDKGTTQFLSFLTCSIVVAGKRFTIDAIPIHQFDEIEELVDQIVKRAKKKINIDKIYLDRGFDKPRVINVLKANHVKFVMPKIRSDTVKAWMDKSEACKSRIIKDFQIGIKENQTTVDLVLVDDEEGIKRAFIINFDIPEQLTHYLYRWYSKRWGIETKYRQLEHDFKAKTTSNNYLIRLFYFLFSTCLFNIWILVNLILSIILTGRISEKPIVTAKLFATILHRVQSDPGG